VVLFIFKLQQKRFCRMLLLPFFRKIFLKTYSTSSLSYFLEYIIIIVSDKILASQRGVFIGMTSAYFWLRVPAIILLLL